MGNVQTYLYLYPLFENKLKKSTEMQLIVISELYFGRTWANLTYLQVIFHPKCENLALRHRKMHPLLYKFFKVSSFTIDHWGYCWMCPFTNERRLHQNHALVGYNANEKCMRLVISLLHVFSIITIIQTSLWLVHVLRIMTNLTSNNVRH